MEQLGFTSLEYNNQERMKLARATIGRIAKNVLPGECGCGFADVNYFIRVFKNIAGSSRGLTRVVCKEQINPPPL